MFGSFACVTKKGKLGQSRFSLCSSNKYLNCSGNDREIKLGGKKTPQIRCCLKHQLNQRQQQEMEQGAHLGGAKRAPAPRVISCRPTSNLSCHVSPQQLWNDHEAHPPPPKHTTFNLEQSGQSNCIKVNPQRHSQRRILPDGDECLCVFFNCVCVCVELGAGAWNRWSARCLKDRA